MSSDYQINAHQNGADNIKITEHDNPFNNIMSPQSGEVEDGEIDDDEPIPESLNLPNGLKSDSDNGLHPAREKEISVDRKSRKRSKHKKKRPRKENIENKTAIDRPRGSHDSPHKRQNKQHGRSSSRSKQDSHHEGMELDNEEFMGVYGRRPPMYGSASDGSRSKSRSPHYSSENEYYSPTKREKLADAISDEECDIHVALYEKEGSFRPQNHPKEFAPRKKIKDKRRMQKSKEYFNRCRRREPEQPPKKNQFRERSLCKYYKEGRCGKAENCDFSHDFQPPKKQELCKFYATSTCLKGDHCIYLHDEFPCKFYHTGSRYCRESDACKFSHNSLTKDTRALLERFVEERPFALDGDEEVPQDFYDGYQSPEEKRPSLLGSPPSNKLSKRRDYSSEEGLHPKANFRDNHASHENPNFDGSPPNRPNNYYDQPNQMSFGSMIRGSNPPGHNPQMPLNQRLPPNMMNSQGPNGHLPPGNINNPNMFMPPNMNGPPPMQYNRPPPMMRGPPRMQGQQAPNFMNRQPHFAMRMNPNIPPHPNMRMGMRPLGMRPIMNMPPQDYMNTPNVNDQLDLMAKFIVTGKELNDADNEPGVEGITNDESEEGLSPSFLKRTNAEPLIVKMGPVTLSPSKKPAIMEEAPAGAYIPDKSVEIPDVRLEAPPVTDSKSIFSPNSTASLFNSSSLEQPAQTPQSPDSKSPTINIISSGPPKELVWRLIAIEVPIKVPYPLMKLPTDLPHLHNDPRLKGQVGVLLPKDPRPRTSSSESAGQEKLSLVESPTPKMPSALLEKPPPFQLDSEMIPPPPPILNQSISVSSVSSETSPKLNTDLLGIAFGASTNVPIPNQPSHKPFQLQLNEMSSLQNSSQQSGSKSGRSYLADPRFRRRKATTNSESGANANQLEDDVSSELMAAEK